MPDQSQNQNPQNGAQPQQELTEGVVGLFHTISGTKTKIVYTNLFTGKIQVKSGGFFFNFPWRTKPVKISLDQQKVDTVCRKSTTLGLDGQSVGPEVSYDTDYFIKIVDPQKFMDVAYSNSPSQIKKNIGEMLDQKIQDYIRKQSYTAFITQNSVDFLNHIGQRQNGVFPPGSLNQELLEQYGIEVTKITFKVRPPQRLIDEAEKMIQAKQAADRAEIDQKRQITEAKTAAESKKLTSGTDIELFRSKLEVLRSTLTPEQTTEYLTTEAIANGTGSTNVNLFKGDFGGSKPSADTIFLGQTIGAKIEEGFSRIQSTQAPQSAPQSQQPRQSTPLTLEQWASLPDDEYLTHEDSLKLAQERKTTIVEGARYRISLLTEEEKTRYQVAAEKGKTK